MRANYLEGNLYFGIFALLLGFIIIVKGNFLASNILSIIVGLILIAIGAMRFIEKSRGGQFCPNCNNKEMIALDNPQAIQIIKENNLSVPKS